MKPRSRIAFVALLGGATGIGFAPVLVRLSETGPTATAFYRLLFALPFLGLWALWDRRQNPAARQPKSRHDFVLLAIGGLLFTADLSIWHWSLQYTTVTNSTLLTNVAPLFVTIGAWLIFGDRIRLNFVAGMVLAIAGACLLVRHSVTSGIEKPSHGLFQSQHLFGDMLSILAAVFYAGYLLAVKHLRALFSTPTIMAWSGLTSCAGFGTVAVLSGDSMTATSPRGWWVLLALALVSHVGGQTLIAYGFGHLPASFSAVSLLWQPVVAAAVAWMVLGESLTWLQGLGALVVLAGIALSSGTIRRPSTISRRR